MKKQIKQHVGFRVRPDFASYVREEAARRGVKQSKIFDEVVDKYMQEVVYGNNQRKKQSK